LESDRSRIINPRCGLVNIPFEPHACERECLAR